MKYLINFITLLAIIITIITPNTIFAVTKSPTQTPTSVASPTPTIPIDEKVNEIRQVIKEKVTQIKDKMDKRAFVGIIKEFTGSTLIITNIIGQQRLLTDETTTFISSNNKEVRINDLAVGDKLIALGLLIEENELQAIRITVIGPDKQPVPLNG